jgi:CBS domain-containing protein
MQTNLVTLDPTEPARAAAAAIADYELAALPVVNDEDRLLGAVTFDAAMTQLAPRGVAGETLRVFS